MVAATYVPDVGDIIKIDLDPRTAHEQGGSSPALVLSPKIYNGKNRTRSSGSHYQSGERLSFRSPTSWED